MPQSQFRLTSAYGKGINSDSHDRGHGFDPSTTTDSRETEEAKALRRKPRAFFFVAEVRDSLRRRFMSAACASRDRQAGLVASIGPDGEYASNHTNERTPVRRNRAPTHTVTFASNHAMPRTAAISLETSEVFFNL